LSSSCAKADKACSSGSAGDDDHAAATKPGVAPTAWQLKLWHSVGLSAAQVIPALAGAILGIPGGLKLLAAADPDSTTTMPPLWQLLAVVPGTVLVVAGLTAIPARISARRPVADILQSELA
jgi:putative ABC transport system permease protein